MIPKIINYIWLGNNEKPRLVKKAIRSWKKRAPSFEIKEWNEKNLESLMEKNVFYHDALNNKEYSYASDIARLVILKKFGGIYIDTDVYLLSDPSPYLSTHDLVFSIQNERSKYISMGFIAAKPNQDFINEMINKYNSKLFDKKKIIPNSQEFGPILFDKYNLRQENKTQFRDKGKIAIYNSNVFYQPSFKSVAFHIGAASWQENLTSHDKIRIRLRQNLNNRFEAGIFKIFNDVFRHIIPNF